MAVFTIVKKKPESLASKAYVIDRPNFDAEIKKCDHKKPRSNMASINYLRELVASIGAEYYGATFDTFKIPVSRYKGMPTETNEQIHELVVKMMANPYPDLNDKYVEKHIIARPNETQVIYFLGELSDTTSFKRHGIVEVEPKNALNEIKTSKAFKAPKPAAAKKQEPATPHETSVKPETSSNIIMPKTLKNK